MPNKKLNKIVLSIFISLIMITSIAGFITLRSPNEEVIKYKDYKFTKVQQGYISFIEDTQIFINNNPLIIDKIEDVPINLNDLNSAAKIYIAFNPSENLDKPLTAFFMNIKPLLTPRVIQSCTEDSPLCKELPLKTCEDATLSQKIIMFKKDNITETNYKDNCLLFKGQEENITIMVDKLVLQFLVK